ncbi:succinate dehydrogenase assembly factor 2 [Aquisalimonas asiatica]|uniref:FAD assembly factor SdhE n=1 Tax=Aquisalimonas asiatica TaxID=406100 RepID=A0A1H8QCJ3_9GAMM|nr:succinate dehydrogenase assembly factor 2 [Aquisalimonas asiatica]SEO51711.1 antitoxin CptB [Aquisalimonas asiatica]
MSERSRLRWRCRRGMRELDLLLEHFLDNGYAALDTAQREAFETLLACQDDTLFGWFYQGEEPDNAELAGLVERIRSNFGLSR